MKVVLKRSVINLSEFRILLQKLLFFMMISVSELKSLFSFCNPKRENLMASYPHFGIPFGNFSFFHSVDGFFFFYGRKDSWISFRI